MGFVATCDWTCDSRPVNFQLDWRLGVRFETYLRLDVHGLPKPLAAT